MSGVGGRRLKRYLGCDGLSFNLRLMQSNDLSKQHALAQCFPDTISCGFIHLHQLDLY